MYVHLFFVNSPIFNSEYVKFIEKHFNISDHRFIFAYNESYLLVKEIKECKYDSSILGMKGSLKYIKNNIYTQVFFHSMHFKAIYLVPKKYLKKIKWCSWGHDLDNIPIQSNGLKQRIKAVVVRSKIMSINSFIAGFKGDLTTLSEMYPGIGIKMINAIYPMGYDLSEFPEPNTDLHAPIRIMIGHSAFPYLQHEKYLAALAPYSDKVCLYLVLNYGDKEYAERLKQFVTAKFDNYRFLEDFLDQKTYVNLLNEVDCLVFDFTKQAAFGNILLGMYLKKVIYLAENGAMYKAFMADHLYFRTCQSLLEDIIDSKMAYGKEELVINQNWAKEYLEENQVIDQWKNVFQVTRRK